MRSPASVKGCVCERQGLRIADIELHTQMLRCRSIACRIYHALADIDSDRAPAFAHQSREFEGVVAKPTTDIERRFRPRQLQAS